MSEPLAMIADSALQEMLNALQGAPDEILPSKFWEELNKRHLAELKRHGYESFKRTVAWWYFTWLLGPYHPYFRFLLKTLPFTSLLKSCLHALLAGKHQGFSWRGSLAYNLFTCMLWEYASRHDSEGLLRLLAEPEEGNPMRVFLAGKHISQDLANSFLEYKAILGSTLKEETIRTILELGAGYGRTAYVVLKLRPDVRYIIVDLPPALYIAQRYLTNQFPERQVFNFRSFTTYHEISQDFEHSKIAFLLPTQLRLLPNKIVDLFVNISSFHEMRPNQIEYYFSQVDRLARFLYIKEKKSTIVPIENVTLRENDYPIRGNWKKLYWRDCLVQTDFFEALLRL